MEGEENGALFCWDDVLSECKNGASEKELKKLRSVLKYDFDIDWVENAEITISDVESINIGKNHERPVKVTMDKNGKKATLEISDIPCYELKVEEKNDKRYLYKIKKAYVLIKVKPEYAEEFCIMMIACQGLCNRAKSRTLAELDDVFSVLGPYDFVLELGGVGKDEEERDNKLNRTLFKIRENLGGYIYETCTLTQYDLLKILGDEAKKYLLIAEKYKSGVEPIEYKNFLDKLKKRIVEFDKVYHKYEVKTPTKYVYVLVKVKPPFTEEFFLEMVRFKTLCTDRDPPYDNLARIDKVCYLVGPFDFLLKIRGEDDKITKTILEIREILGDCINETITIEKYQIPMTKEELEKHFERILGEKSLIRWQDGKKIPKESLNPNDEIDLKEISDAKETQLKKLLNKAYLFNWSDFTENDKDRLIKFLKKRYCIGWVDSKNVIQNNKDGTITVPAEKNSISLKLNHEKTKVWLEVDNRRTDEFIVKPENGELNIYDKAKPFLETWELNKQVCELSNRVAELEKRIK